MEIELKKVCSRREQLSGNFYHEKKNATMILLAEIQWRDDQGVNILKKCYGECTLTRTQVFG